MIPVVSLMVYLSNLELLFAFLAGAGLLALSLSLCLLMFVIKYLLIR